MINVWSIQNHTPGVNGYIWSVLIRNHHSEAPGTSNNFIKIYTRGSGDKKSKKTLAGGFLLVEWVVKIGGKFGSGYRLYYVFDE